MVVNTNLNKNDQADKTTSDKPAEIASVIEETRDMTKEILKLTKKIKAYILFQQVFTFLKLLLIIAPIIAAWIYLPRLIDDFKVNPQALIESSFFAPYIEGIVGTAAEKLDPSNIDLDKLPSEYKNLLKK
ncbi:hypothetical protein K8R32_00695 [bacterium]|nr:hypothetical protein [bacterium]